MTVWLRSGVTVGERLRRLNVILSGAKNLRRFDAVIPVSCQINPSGIGRFDQRHLLASQPPFDLLLPGDGGLDIVGGFVVREPGEVVPLREPFHRLLFVLVDSPN